MAGILLQEKFLIRDVRRITSLLPSKLRWKVYFFFLFMMFVAIFEVVNLLSLCLVGLTIGAPSIVYDSHVTKFLFAVFPALKEFCSEPQWMVFTVSIVVVGINALKNLLLAILMKKQAIVSEDVAEYVGDAIMANYLCNTYMWHLSGDSNKTIFALNSRQSLATFLMNIFSVYAYAMTSVALVVLIISSMPILILIVLLVTGFLCWSIYTSMKRALDKSGLLALQSSSEETRVCNNAIHGIREVLIYRQQPVFQEKFIQAMRTGNKARVFLSIAPPIPTFVLETYAISVVPLTTWILIHYYNASMPMITAALTIVIMSAWRAFPLLNRSISSLVIVRSVRHYAMLCIERLEEIKNEQLTPQTDPDPNFRINNEICLHNVDFRYPGSDRLVLENINFKITHGCQIGIVGVSGSGKSTLAGILAGLLDPIQGNLLVDGKAMTPSEVTAYRAKIGYVPQNPYLMAGSIAENVSFSQWGKPWDDEKVKKACDMAALDVVQNDDRGINYPIGENGAGLSGGQAQRVSIARALYADPEILILDESTSSLDLKTEQAIMETIDALKNNMTIVIIAHRLATVEHCDWIIWIRDGKLYRQGATADVLPDYRESLTEHCVVENESA